MPHPLRASDGPSWGRMPSRTRQKIRGGPPAACRSGLAVRRIRFPRQWKAWLVAGGRKTGRDQGRRTTRRGISAGETGALAAQWAERGWPGLRYQLNSITFCRGPLTDLAVRRLLVHQHAHPRPDRLSVIICRMFRIALSPFDDSHRTPNLRSHPPPHPPRHPRWPPRLAPDSASVHHYPSTPGT